MSWEKDFAKRSWSVLHSIFGNAGCRYNTSSSQDLDEVPSDGNCYGSFSCRIMRSPGELHVVCDEIPDIMTSRKQLLHDAEEYDLENFETVLLDWPARHRIKLHRSKKLSPVNNKKSAVLSRQPRISQAKKRLAMNDQSGLNQEKSDSSSSKLEDGDVEELPASGLFELSGQRHQQQRRRLHQNALRTVSILDTLTELAKGGADCHPPDRRSLPPDLDIVATTANPVQPKNGRSLDNILSYVREGDEDSPADSSRGSSNSSSRPHIVSVTAFARENLPMRSEYKSPLRTEEKPSLPTRSRKTSGHCKSRKDNETKRNSKKRHYPLNCGNTPEWIRSIFDLVKRGRTKQLAASLEEMDAILIRNLCDHHGNNLFHACALTGESENLKVLLQKGPVCEEALYDENKHGHTPAVLSVKRGHLNFVKCLVGRTSIRDCITPPDGSRPLLHWAAKYGQTSIVKWLLEHMENKKLDVNLRDQDGNTAAHFAARYGFVSCLRIFAEHFVDVTLSNNLGHKPSDSALMYGHEACAEYLMAVESCSLLASDISSIEQDLQSIKSESLELRNHFRDVVSYLKKLLKEREEMAASMNTLHEQMVRLNEQLISGLQVLAKENAALREKVNGGRKKDGTEKQLEETLEMRNSLQRQWQEEQKRWFSGAWQSEWETRLLLAEERWRRARNRLSRTVDPCRQPRTIISERLQQVRCRSANVKLSEAKNLSSSESSLSSLDSDTNEGDAEKTSVVTDNPEIPSWQPRVQQPPIPVRLEQRKAGFTPSSRAKVHFSRRLGGGLDNGELKRVRSAPHIASQRPSSDCLAKLAADVFQELGIRKPGMSSMGFGEPHEATCSVLEVIEPPSNGDVTNLPLSMDGHDSCSEPSFFPSGKRSTAETKLNECSVHKTTKTDKNRSTDNKDLNNISMYSIPEAEQDLGNAISLGKCDNQGVSANGNVSGTLMPIATVTQEPSDSKMQSPSNLMSAEPDLIKGTKGIRAYDDFTSKDFGCYEPTESVSGGRSESQPSFTSEESSDCVHPSLEAPPVPRPRTFRCAENGTPVTLTTGTNSSTKRKGFLQKFSLRWPSKRKDVKTTAKKIQEITPEDFREMYLAARNNSIDEVDVSELASGVVSAIHGSPFATELATSSNEGLLNSEEVLNVTSERSECEGSRELDVPPLEEKPVSGVNSPEQTTTTGEMSILTLSDLAARDEAMVAEHSRVFQLRLSSSSSLSNVKDSDPDERPASSASKCEALSRPESSASRFDLAVLKAAGFPMYKSSSGSTDMLPESSTVSRMSPAPSEVSKTESALLSPPSDVSRTESVRHPAQLTRIEEIVNRDTNSAFTGFRPTVQVKQATILDISSNKTENTPQQESPTPNSPPQSPGEQASLTLNKKRRHEEKPWYDVSDDEDMLTPERLQCTGLLMRTSSDDEEGAFLHSG